MLSSEWFQILQKFERTGNRWAQSFRLEAEESQPRPRHHPHLGRKPSLQRGETGSNMFLGGSGEMKLFSEFQTPNRRSGKLMIFVFETLRSMGRCIKWFTTISPNFCRRFEKVKERISYERKLITSVVTKYFLKYLRTAKGLKVLQFVNSLPSCQWRHLFLARKTTRISFPPMANSSIQLLLRIIQSQMIWFAFSVREFSIVATSAWRPTEPVLTGSGIPPASCAPCAKRFSWTWWDENLFKKLIVGWWLYSFWKFVMTVKWAASFI